MHFQIQDRNFDYIAAGSCCLMEFDKVSIYTLVQLILKPFDYTQYRPRR